LRLNVPHLVVAVLVLGGGCLGFRLDGRGSLFGLGRLLAFLRTAAGLLGRVAFFARIVFGRCRRASALLGGWLAGGLGLVFRLFVVLSYPVSHRRTLYSNSIMEKGFVEYLRVSRSGPLASKEKNNTRRNMKELEKENSLRRFSSTLAYAFPSCRGG
jgi:hypothetical protein